MTGAERLDYWAKCWEDENISWHETEANVWLTSNLQVLTGYKKKQKILVPLCGKSLDLKWLADKGHDVVGVDACSKPIEAFFHETGLKFTTQPMRECEGTLYKSEDGTIRLYCCNVFNFTSAIEGTFGAIWDRAAMVAIHPELLQSYHETIKSLMGLGCQYVLARVIYDIPGKTDDPYLVRMETLWNNFGPSYKIEQLNRSPCQNYKDFYPQAVFYDIEMIRISWNMS